MQLGVALFDLVLFLLVEDLRIAQRDRCRFFQLVDHLRNDRILLVLLALTLKKLVRYLLSLGLERGRRVHSRLLLKLHFLVLRCKSLLKLLHPRVVW